ncbi:hypothetical protein F8M41_019635 [Gigaspora margarita]|uniref:Uncharacterized protein n=1 Tax=Gigaspora margarita TaxID=4874 RepID=A0A8H4AJL9_GIGMA|nr:hypothetical protein F8M41_019635 [Gigaspora margarita]
MYKFLSEEEVKKLNKKERRSYRKFESECLERIETKRNQKLKYAKFKDLQSIVQNSRLENTKDYWELVKQLDRTDEELPKIDDPQLYDKFLRIINLILLYCRKLKLPQDNKVIQKYEKLKTEINDLPNPNKFVIERSIKFSKYEFAPQLYEKHPELIFLLIKLEKYYISISQQVPKKQKNIIKKNNNTSVPIENLSKWVQQNYNKVIKKGFEIDIEEYNISIENDNFVNIVRGILYELTNACYDLYNLKNTNPLTIKYKKIEESIDNTTNKKQFILELAEKFSLFSNKFDPINYRFKPKLLPYIK